MATPGGLVDKTELINAQLDTAHLGRVVNSKDASGNPIDTSTNRTGGVNKTLDALETEYLEAIQGTGGISVGTWTAGVTTFNAYNEYAVYNGIPYKPRTSTALPYVAQGANPTATPDDANVQPYQEITEAQVVNISASGDSAITDSVRFPKNPTESAVNGQTIPQGVSSVIINGEQYVLSGEKDGLEFSKVISDIDLTPPYSCDIDGVKNYLLKLPYFQKGRSVNDIRALGSVGDFDDTTKVGTDNSEVFRAISRDLGGEWTGVGKFYTSTTTNYKKRTAWSAPNAMGAGVSFDFSIVTADGIPGHFYHYIDTDANDSGVPVVTTATTGADGSSIGDGVTIRNVTNTNKPAFVANAYGVWAKVRVKIGNANISNWQSNNVHIVATEISSDPLIRGNANSFHLDNPILWGSGADGFYCEGADVNAGIGSTVSAYRNVGYGINDSSFLGNYWPSPNIGLNDTGGVNFSNVNNRSIVINPYFELGSAGFEVTSSGRQGVIGGNVDDTSLSNAAFLYVDQSEWRANTSLASYQVVDSSNFRSRIGGATSAATLGIQSWESESIDSNTWRLQWEPSNKSDFHLRYANLVGSTAYTVTGENTTIDFGTASPKPYQFHQSNIAFGTSDGGRRMFYLSILPTSGEFAKGDIIWTRSANAGGKAGWYCTTGGTAGSTAVFKQMAAIDA